MRLSADGERGAGEQPEALEVVHGLVEDRMARDGGVDVPEAVKRSQLGRRRVEGCIELTKPFAPPSASKTVKMSC